MGLDKQLEFEFMEEIHEKEWRDCNSYLNKTALYALGVIVGAGALTYGLVLGAVSLLEKYVMR